MTIYGYARCSTNEDKQDITRQTRELKDLGVDKANMYFEYASGTKTDRVELNKLLKIVKEGDTIIATELSRITRSTKQLIEIIEIAKKLKLKIVLGTFTLDCTGEIDPMTEGMLKMMGVFAEMERDMISQRVKSGIANAKANGKVVGRPTTTIDDLPTNFLKHYPMFKNKQLTKMDLSRLCNLSRPCIDKYIKIIEGK